jgi:hypothetical protein
MVGCKYRSVCLDRMISAWRLLGHPVSLAVTLETLHMADHLGSTLLPAQYSLRKKQTSIHLHVIPKRQRMSPSRTETLAR